jgi:CheY-like chemotaxis protein
LSGTLVVLAVDDEAPALDELAFLLSEHDDIAEVTRASDATSALRELNRRTIDAVFLDINMPGLSGLELAGVLTNFSYRPAVVFVTAHDDKAVAAFDVGAVDYLLKPIRASRLDEAVRRVLAARSDTTRPDTSGDTADQDADVIPAEVGGITHLVPRDSIGWSGYRSAPSNPVGGNEVSNASTAPTWWRCASSSGCAPPTAPCWSGYVPTARPLRWSCRSAVGRRVNSGTG